MDDADGAFTVTPIWLLAGHGPVFAMLHEPELEARERTAVLLCPPFGWEELCAHRALRAWANRLAQAGFTAARIDLPSTGESGGNAEEPGRLEAWTAAVSEAAGWLRHTSGAERLVALGIGLGGMVATRALAQGAPIDDLILWAVPARGRSLVRELRAQAGIIAALYPDDAQTPSPYGGSDVTGYLLSTETEGDLAGLDLTRLPLSDAARRRILLLGRDKLGVDRRLREHFESAGADVTVMDANDYDGLMSHPQETKIPRRTIRGATQWLGRTVGPPSVGEATTAATGPPISSSSSAELGQDGRRIVETPLTLTTAAGRAYAVLSGPLDADPAGVCAVLLNAGALRRTGPSRTWVELSRRWAARGVPTVRLDLEAIGDSDGDDERLAATASLYDPAMTEHVLSALDQLSGHGVPARFVLVGLCSGAYWALHAALQDPRVTAAVMVNLYSFHWSEELVAERDRRKTVAVLRGDVLKRIAGRRVTADQIRRTWRGLRAGIGKSVEADSESEIDDALDTLRDRGTQVSLLLSQGEPLFEQFERDGRLAELHRWPNLSIERMPSSDHMCRAIWLQHHLHERLDVALARGLGPASAPAPAPVG